MWLVGVGTLLAGIEGTLAPGGSSAGTIDGMTHNKEGKLMEDVTRGMGEAFGMFQRDPFKMLHEDHEKVKDLFTKFEQTTSEDDRRDIFGKINKALFVHSSMEEESFYPAARMVIANKQLIDQAVQEHLKIKQDLSQSAMGMGFNKISSMGIGPSGTTRGQQTTTTGYEGTTTGTTGYQGTTPTYGEPTRREEMMTGQPMTGQMGMTGQSMTSLFSSLKNDVLQHVQMEEGQIFPEMQRSLSDDQLQDIAKNMDSIKGGLT
jgi:hemerythrin superfamily protein